jgi:hypothetical protein
LTDVGCLLQERNIELDHAKQGLERRVLQGRVRILHYHGW